jgi:mediator of RNA polymerase II transcription subunit 7
MMEEQLERKQAEIEGIKKMKEKFGHTLAEFARNAPPQDEQASSDEGKSANAEETDEQQKLRELWMTMDEVLGH